MHFLFFCFHRSPPTACRRPRPRLRPRRRFRRFRRFRRLRPSPPVLACPRLSSPVHHPSSPPPFPSLAFALCPVPSSPSPLPLSLIFPSLRPLFIPVYSCLFLSVLVCSCLFLSVLVCSCLFLSVLVCSCLFLSLVPPSFYAPAFLALSFRPVLLVSGTTCSRAFLHFVLFCYPLRASYSGVFFPRPVLHPLRASYSGVLFLHPVLHPLRASFLNLFFGHPFPCPPLRVPPLRILFLLCPSRILINAFNGSVCKEITLFLSGLKIIFIFVVSSD